MPGISLVYDKNGGLAKGDRRILGALESQILFENYRAEVLLDDGRYFLGCVKYSQYPTATFETRDFFIFLEGRIYGRSDACLKDELSDLAGVMLGDAPDAEDRIARWLIEQDGEFILFSLDKKTKVVAILNDALGQLPFYYHFRNGRLIASRSLKFIADLMDGRAYDRMTIAHYLLFRYSMGAGTLLKDVFRLEPGTLMRMAPDCEKIEIRTIYKYCFDHREHSGRTIDENCDVLGEIFLEGCRNRADFSGGSKNVIALSGGLDSRIVAAGLHEISAPVSAVTFMDSGGHALVDVTVARELAKVLAFDWKMITLRPPTGRDFLKLLQMKNGTNYLTMAFILPFFEAIKEILGQDVLYFSGDTGLVLRQLTPHSKLKDVNDLSNDILNRTVFTVQETARLAGLDGKDVLEDVRRCLDAYPEKNMADKHVRFLFYGKGHNWHHEGMDRNRSYFPLATPLESLPLFRYAMNCPEDQKADYAYFGKIISRFSPEAFNLNYAQFGARVGSRKFALRNWIKETYIALPVSVRRAIKKVLGKSRDAYAEDSNLVRCMREQLRNCRSIPEYLPALRSEEATKHLSSLQIELLFTITSAIEAFERPRSSIENYLDLPLV